MRQVLFQIPVGEWLPEGLRAYLPSSLPLYGFGMMLFLAFVICTWLAGRRADREGVGREVIQDLAVWIFLGGIVGARLAYLFAFGLPLSQFFKIWDGGLIFYGSAIGGVVGYLLAYVFLLRRRGLSSWKIADVIAPSVAVGLALGRIGCFLNGCCYGNVACADCPAVHFPLSSAPRTVLTAEGYQTCAGFAMAERAADGRTVQAVEPDSAAAAAGLRAGDVIVAADGHPIESYRDLWYYLGIGWPRGKNDLTLTVQRGQEQVTLPPFVPRTIGLHPTQLYSSFGAFLIFLVLTAFYPFRRRDGEVMVLLMFCYAAERLLEEALRNDTPPITLAGISTGMTLSQNISLLVFAAGLAAAAWLLRRPVQYQHA